MAQDIVYSPDMLMVLNKVFRTFFLAAVCLGITLFPATAQETRDIADRDAFNSWLAELKADALSQGIGEGTLNAALADIEPIGRVIELDRRQPEFTLTFSEYITGRVTNTRIDRGRALLDANRSELEKVSETYGVPGPIIVAIWGMETNFGTYLGSFPVIGALATLAYDGRREFFFRKELLNALKIIDQGHITAGEMKGSWAGAMGQSQFMPSSFLNFAVDFTGDGRADIWTSEADVFASIANYLSRNGWRDGHGWGRLVHLPPELSQTYATLLPENPPASCKRALDDHTVQRSLDEWAAAGVRDSGGAVIRGGQLQGSLVRPEAGGPPTYLTYPNYRAILRYNCSNFYALAVGLLADAIDHEPAVDENASEERQKQSETMPADDTASD